MTTTTMADMPGLNHIRSRARKNPAGFDYTAQPIGGAEWFNFTEIRFLEQNGYYPLSVPRSGEDLMGLQPQTWRRWFVLNGNVLFVTLCVDPSSDSFGKTRTFDLKPGEGLSANQHYAVGYYARKQPATLVVMADGDHMLRRVPNHENWTAFVPFADIMTLPKAATPAITGEVEFFHLEEFAGVTYMPATEEEEGEELTGNPVGIVGGARRLQQEQVSPEPEEDEPRIVEAPEEAA